MPIEQQYTDEELLTEARRVLALLPDGPVGQIEFDRLSRVHVRTLTRRFGDWREVLVRAGHADRYTGRTISPKMREQRARTLTDEEIIAELERVARVKGSRTITKADLRDGSAIIGGRVVVDRFGSFRAGLEAAGLTMSHRVNRWSDDDYRENLRTLVEHYGRAPTMAEAARPPGRIHPTSYQYKFGSWTAAKQACLEPDR